MRSILTSAAMFALLAAPALAQDAKLEPKSKVQAPAATGERHDPETIHPPTNRIGEAVPNMTAPAEEKLPATNRVGETVPRMKDKSDGNSSSMN
ncbi:MAG: hypothetical protein AB7U75_08545 [Hyphomicrobiaceae bacterium]